MENSRLSAPMRLIHTIVGSGLILLLICLGPLLASAQTAPAHRAGIYIDFGNGEQTMLVVPFDEPEISSLELLERSEVPILTVGFGGLGNAVCAIEATGCDISACRRTLCQEGDRNAPFWQFVQQRDGTDWTVSPLGASAARVEDGTIDAWFWTGETPNPPALSIDDLVSRTGFSESNAPSQFTTLDRSDGERRNSIVLGVSLIVLALILGGGLVLAQKRKHAAR